jgi:hypothetical protein
VRCAQAIDDGDFGRLVHIAPGEMPATCEEIEFVAEVVMTLAACAHALVAGSTHRPAQGVSLLTNNVRDFNVRNLTKLGIVATRPDGFLIDLCGQDATGVAAERLSADGQVRTAAALRDARRRGAGTAAL